jgi:quercetin dioxygenase-like cupin family protein
MEITRTVKDSRPGPSEWFTGEVWLDEIVAPMPPSRLSALSVHFAPGARTAWHQHPFGQVIHVTEGVGLAQRRGGRVEVIRPGDTVRFEPDEEHWHGATPERFMTHLALQEADDEGTSAYWSEHVSDSDYLAEPTGG